MFNINEFSKLVQVTPRMLRHYEECELFLPAEIERSAGYRYYSAKQIPLLSNIIILQDMGFSEDEISEILPHLEDQADTGEGSHSIMTQIRGAIEAEQIKIEMHNYLPSTMRELFNITVSEVELKELPSVEVLLLREVISSYRDKGEHTNELGAYIGENYFEHLPGEYITLLDEEYKEADINIEIAIPAAGVGSDDGRFVSKTYPAIPQAATVRFTGPFDGGYNAACEKLADWTEEQGYSFAGVLRLYEVITSYDDENRANWVKELQVPVVKA